MMFTSFGSHVIRHVFVNRKSFVGIIVIIMIIVGMVILWCRVSWSRLSRRLRI